MLSSRARQLGSHVFHSKASLVGVAAAGTNLVTVMDEALAVGALVEVVTL